MIDFDDVREQSFGKWLSIWRSLGIDVNETGRHSACPCCGGKDRFRVDKNVAEKGSYYCNGCGPGFGFDLIMKVMAVDIKEAMESVASVVGGCEKSAIPKEKAMTPEFLRKIFVESSPAVNDDVVGAYLKKRGLSSVPECLRYSKKCWESETKMNQKAMLSLFHSPDNKALTMHRTYLDADGNKLGIDKPKKILPPLQKMTGGAVRLFAIESGALGVAEGIETAIAAHEDTGLPVWAALSSTLLESFEVPKEVEKLTIFADNDTNYAGQKAAFALANRVSIKGGVNVSVYIPAKPGEDWLDVFTAQKN